jgi:DNA-binding ferritin-like protein (Dps family)
MPGQMIIIKSKNAINKVKGSDEIKYKYLIDYNGIEYYALFWDSIKYPIIYDSKFDNEISKFNWYILQIGYASTHNDEINYMHKLISKLAKIPNYENADLSVDHINREKLDNRIKNLRMATQGQQNSNRDTRSDKKPPCQELINIGVLELPKYVRWDNTEKKFIIEKHPQLIKEITQGIRTKPTMSGTKSTKLTVIQKYQDIISRLQDLDELNNNTNLEEFKKLSDENKKEYDAIYNSIKIYEGLQLEEKSDSETSNKSDPVILKRNTAAGRKTVSKLPENCGVNIEDIPKYCWYRAATEKRGDKFIIDKHPKLLEQGKNHWGTTESIKKTTLEKFNIMMEKYEELSL